MSEIISGISSTIANENSRGRFGEDTNRLSSGSDIEIHMINESFSGIVTSFTVYKLITELTKPITQLNAYKKGIIDERGNYLQDPDSVNLNSFDRMVIGIKRLILSTGSSKLRSDYSYFQTAAKAMAFECAQVGGNEDLFLSEIYKCVDVLLEDGEGSIGNVAGDGFSNPQVGEPNPALAGYSPPMTILKRKKNKKEEIL